MVLHRKAGIKDLKETFWLLLRIWEKVTRSAERKEVYEYKVIEKKQIYLKNQRTTKEQPHPPPSPWKTKGEGT